MAVPDRIMDGYIGGIGSASFIPQNPRPAFGDPATDDPDGQADRAKTPVTPNGVTWFNQTDEDKMTRWSARTDDADVNVKSTNINKTEEYNTGYAGLSILPWEEFAFNPRVLNELFYQERTQYVTYDPEDVNVFFHGKNVMPPTVGDISENGKSWNVVVDTVNDLRRIRGWLTERCSVFGVTLVYQKGRFGKKQRAPCLVMMDPSKGCIADKIYTTITRAIDSLHNQRRFCVEINLNGCVERWCRRVLLTDCKAVGARLIITNGEEYTHLNGAEDIVCCVVCLPLWLLQAGIYKLHRKVVYDDFALHFDADDMFLHGTYQDVKCQRQQILHSTESGQVFRTRSAGQTNISTLNELGSFKFMSVKKYKKNEEDHGAEGGVADRMKEHSTIPFNEFIQERKERVRQKEKKLMKKMSKSSYPKTSDKSDALANNDETEVKVAFTTGTPTEGTVESEGFINKCCEISDDEDMAKIPQIPEVASVFFDESGDGSDFTTESGDDGGQRLFSPKMKNHTSMSLNNALFDSTDFEARDSAVQPFTASDDDDVIDDNSETDEESNEMQKKRGNAELLNELSKIESTLPALRNENMFAAKDLETIAAEEKSKKEKSDKKKKRKNKKKPAVGRVLKDLMKTTEVTDGAPSVEDKRYQNSLSNINKKFDSKKASSKDALENGTDKGLDSDKSRDHDKTKSLEMLTDVDKLSLSSDTKEKTPSEIRASKCDTKGAGDMGNEVCEIEQFNADSDSSSTDGDEVEMLYQSDRTEKPRFNKNNMTMFETPNKHSKVSTPKTIKSKPLDKEDTETLEEFEPVTGEAKLEIVALNSNRNAKFNAARLFDASSAKPSFSFSMPDKSTSQAISVQDADLSDDGIEEVESVNISTDVVQSPATPEASVSQLKTQFSAAPSKKQKRGTKQYNSNRKYLGAAVSGPKKKHRSSREDNLK